MLSNFRQIEHGPQHGLSGLAIVVTSSKAYVVRVSKHLRFTWYS